MKIIHIQQIELLSLGLDGWANALPYLQGKILSASTQAPPKYNTRLLPPNERRRATALTRMVFNLAEYFLDNPNTEPASNWTNVFATSGGDYAVVDAICRDLALGNPISPTQFHNSVHNAVAGYWSIATQAKLSSTTISAFDDTFAAGLLEASILCQTLISPVFLCIYDEIPPPLLKSVRNINCSFAGGLLLSCSPSAKDIASFTCKLDYTAEPASTCINPSLEALRIANPAARLLPLAEAIARHESRQIRIAYGNQQLMMELRCHGQ